MYYGTRVLFVLLMVWSVTVSAHAAPGISGVEGKIATGETLVIKGNSFGTRGNYNNVNASYKGQNFLAFRVKDFDDQSLSSQGFNNPGSSWMIRSGGRTGSGSYATKYYNGQRLGALSATQQGTTGTWYMSYWFMMPSNTSSSKPWRIYGGGSAANIYLATGGSGSGEGPTLRGYSECTASNCSPSTVWSSPDTFKANQWSRVEVVMHQGGSFTTFINGKQQWSREGWVGNPFNGNGHTIDLGNMINAATSGGDDPSNNSYNFDDVYFDFTLARVEIGNSSTWSASTHKEVQVPTDWSTGQIKVVVNRGSLPSGSSAYLYVVDANGNVNTNGYPIKIGDSASSPPPSNPPSSDTPEAPARLQIIGSNP